MTSQNTHWQRAIILVDMNSFFASIEQLDFPELREQPIGVTNGMQGTCLITSSYEARAYGVKTGMRLPEAKKLCPHLIQRPSRPKRYAQVSTGIINSLYDITPDIEVFSVDEAFLDVTRCQKLHGSPEIIAQMVKKKIAEVSNLPCSIGVSGDKTTAKYAAELKKPNGLVIIPPWESKKALHNIPVTELCGIGDGIAAFLARYGVYHCGDMQRIPISILAKRFGNLGRRIWCMCQGADPEPVKTITADPQSMGHGKVIPPNTKDRQTILLYFSHMSEKLAARLRRHNLQAQYFFIGVRSWQLGWLGMKTKLTQPTDDGKMLLQLCEQVMNQSWFGEPVGQVQLTALDPMPARQQLDLFAAINEDRKQLNATVDAVNKRYGELTLAPARLLSRSSMPDVIAPAWRPFGHRQSV